MAWNLPVPPKTTCSRAAASQQLLGVDAVREFNVLRDSYGAEYGKRPGGQVSIVTQSGTNQLHGRRLRVPPQQRSRRAEFLRPGIGAAISSATSSAPRSAARSEPTKPSFRQLRRIPPASAPDLGGLCSRCRLARRRRPQRAALCSICGRTPPQALRISAESRKSSAARCKQFAKISELFGLTTIFVTGFSLRRLHHRRWQRFHRDRLGPLQLRHPHPARTGLQPRRNSSFSRPPLNIARVGYSRAGYFFTGEPTPGTPAASVPGFSSGHPGRRRRRRWQRRIKSASGDRPRRQQQRKQSQRSPAICSPFEDRVALTHGRHQLTFGAWFQPFQSNETIALSQYGQLTFSSLANFLNRARRPVFCGTHRRPR